MVNLKMIKEKLRPLKKNERVLLWHNKYSVSRQKKLEKKYSDLEAIIKSYQDKTGRIPDLENPKRFTEKIQWLKLNYRNPTMNVCADKYTVREFIISKGYQHILISSYGTWDDVEDIPFDSLPEKFILKATHGCGMNLISKNKSELNWKLWKKIMRSWLERDISIDGREWVYKNMPRKIICEEFIEDESNKGEDLNDYKFLCINGKVNNIFVDLDRSTLHKRNYYDKDWNFMDIESADPNVGDSLPKPERFEEMKKIAEDLSAEFPMVRVDLYTVNGNIYFGEMTFFPWCGYVQYNPDEFDYELGKKLILPKANHSN